MHSIVPSNLVPWVNLGIIVLGVYLIYLAVINSRLAARLTDMMRAHIIKNKIITPVSFEELVVATGGYGVSRIEVCKNSPVLNKSLREVDLPESHILVLGVERAGEITPNPPLDTRIILGDSLVCFGKLIDIRKKVCPIEKENCD